MSSTQGEFPGKQFNYFIQIFIMFSKLFGEYEIRTFGV